MLHRTAFVPLSVVLFVSLTTLSFGETHRVPQDYSLIQRAAWAAAPGDTIEIAEGTYVENVVITKPLTIQGAASGKTIITAKDRSSPILSLNAKGGSSSAANLVLRHEPAQKPSTEASTDEDSYYESTHGLGIFDGTLSLKNITVQNASGTGVAVSTGEATIENLTVTGSSSHGVSLYKVLPGSTFTGVTVSDASSGYNLKSYDSATEFRKLQLDGKGDGFIQVGGPKSNVTFPDLSADLKQKIAWIDGVSAEGPVPESESAELVAEEEEMDAYSAARQAERDEHQAASEPARRQLARNLQTALKDKKDAASYAAELGNYFTALFETYHPGETADFGVDEAISAELRAFFDRFGAQAVVEAIPTWPNYEEFTVQMSYLGFLTRDMQAGYANAIGTNWVKTNRAKLDEFFAAWKKGPDVTPVARAAAFVQGIQQTSEVSKASEIPPEDLTPALHQHLLEEVQLFIAQAGYPALNQLLRQLADSEANGLISAPDIQAALTSEQKRELFKALRTGGAK